MGVAAALVGATSMATGSTLVQRWGRPGNGMAFAGWQLTAGGLLLAPIALVGEGLPSNFTARNLCGYVYLATNGGALAYVIWFRGIAVIGAQRATFLSLLSPVLATIVGVFLGDGLTARQFLGGAVVIASVTLVQLVRPSAKLPARDTPPVVVGSVPTAAPALTRSAP